MPDIFQQDLPKEEVQVLVNAQTETVKKEAIAKQIEKRRAKMDLENQRRVKMQSRKEGLGVFKAAGKSFMILNRKPLERVAAVGEETLAFIEQQRDKVPRSVTLP
jgi:hypothetical protein